MCGEEIFDRIELIQETNSMRFRDRDHTRLGSLAAEGAPAKAGIGYRRFLDDQLLAEFAHNCGFHGFDGGFLSLLVRLSPIAPAINPTSLALTPHHSRRVAWTTPRSCLFSGANRSPEYVQHRGIFW